MAKLSIVPVATPQPKKKASAPRKVKPAVAPRGPVFNAFKQVVRNEKAAEIALYGFSGVAGAFFPVTAYVTAHHGFALDWAHTPQIALTAFCLAFSVPTTLQFGSLAFSGLKAKGFALGLEFAMLAAHPILAIIALTMLVWVNVVSCYYNVSTGKKFSEQ